MKLAFWPGLGGGPRILAELEPAFEAAGIDSGAPATIEEQLAAVRVHVETLRWKTREAFLEQERAESERWNDELAEMAMSKVVERNGEVVPTFDADTIVAINSEFARYDATAILASLSPETRVLLLAAIGEPRDLEAARRELVARFTESVPWADVREIDSGHDILRALGPGAAEIIVDWLEAA